jgi:cell division septal protein FtsQ
MSKKSSVNIPTIAIIRIIVFLFIGFVFFWMYNRTIEFLTTAPIFDVKQVLVDKSISFIDNRPLKELVGQNVFNVNLGKLHHQISTQYPQIAQLSVVRQLPDTIKVLAKKRELLLQVLAPRNKFLIVDTEGVTMFYTASPVPFPVVKGIPLEKYKIVLGAPSTIKELNLVVDLLGQLKLHPNTSKLRVLSIDASNLSKIQMLVMPNIQIMIDQEALSAKVDMLEILFQNGKINWGQVKYIDVRFKEPIINEGVPEEK